MARKQKTASSGGGGGHGGGGELRWLLTYADLITLLLAFFVIMYSMSQTDAKKYQALAHSLAIAFNSSSGGSSVVLDQGGASTVQVPAPEEQSSSDLELLKKKKQEMEIRKKENEEFQKIKEQIEKYAAKLGFKNKVIMNIEERGLVISLADSVMFDTGKANLTPMAIKVLDQMAGLLKQLNNPIRIEGHTDNVPIKNSKYPSNWQLSTDRATTVLIYLIEKHGLSPQKLSAAGYGEYKPIVPNTSEENRSRNRRVDIVILHSSESEKEPK